MLIWFVYWNYRFFYINFNFKGSFNGKELMIMLRGGFERITLQLGKIEFRIIFLFQILKFIFYLLIDN
jgi:hypothetical protein